jgi:hypothetical protein
MEKLKVMPLKHVKKEDYERLLLTEYPNFAANGSITGMKNKYYGKYALLVKCGQYIYNVSSNPHIYHNEAY